MLKKHRDGLSAHPLGNTQIEIIKEQWTKMFLKKIRTKNKYTFIFSRMFAFTILSFIIAEYSFAGTIRVPKDYMSIQSAVNGSIIGDTILVYPGVYKENIAIHKAINLISYSGPSMTLIQDPAPSSGWGTPETFEISIDATGPGIVRGFTILGNNDINGAGVKVMADGWRIEGCVFLMNKCGVNAYGATATIVNNTFKQNQLGIGAERRSIVVQNKIYGNKEYDGIYAIEHSFVANNLLLDCINGINCMGSIDSLTIRNNAIISIGNTYANQQRGVVIGYNGDTPIIENNIITNGGNDGIIIMSSNINITPGYTIAYNDMYMNRHSYFGMPDLTNQYGNIDISPLFCDNDSLFFLTSNSPCIDVGTDMLLDIDGSRSDIGLYGGPYAEEIRYAPSSFDLLQPVDQDSIIVIEFPYVAKIYPKIRFEWSPSFDRDAGDTVKYRFILGRSFINICQDYKCDTKMVADVIDTLYTDSTSTELELEQYNPRTYYYVVEAIDRTGLFKRSNSVRSFVYLRIHNNPKIFSCSQNFPNPVNKFTHIQYTLPYSSHVRIILYDMLGREVRIIEDSYKPVGYHESILDASNLASGIYFYQLQASLFVGTKKLVLLK